jgi:glycosyltransferase A (GT-A) superfamily protein (DUF2064 family)
VNYALLLFTKVPAPGYVKTRLTEGENALSFDEACRLYNAILQDVFDLLTEVGKSLGAKLYVAYTPAERGAEIQQLLSRKTVQANFFPQQGRTTSERIANAFDVAFNDGCDVSVMVFGDQPGLVKELIFDAFEPLVRGASKNGSHLVLGPTCDGGTYLIGLTSNLRKWMRGAIDCNNTSKAVSRLIVKIMTRRASYTLLRDLTDLDDPIDLQHLRRSKGVSVRTARVLTSLVINRKPSAGALRFSVIIPTLDEEETLEKTIESLRTQRVVPGEVIVVDCGSRDRTLEIANAKADRVVVVGHCGRQYQENVGARGAKGDVLLFLHADTLAPPTLLESVATALEDERIMGGGARLRYFPSRVRYRVLCILRDRVSRLLGIFGLGSSFFVRRDVFHDLGGFNEKTNEEGVDMSKRLRKHGKLVMLDDFVQTSPRRYECCGFAPTLSAWAFTIALSYFGVHANWIERHIWRVVR